MSGFAKNVSKIYEPIVNRLTARFSELLMEIDLPNDCMSSLIKLGSAVKDKKKWALNFLRTFPTPKSGLIQGSTSSIGYDECLSIESTNDMSGQSIRGQYCWVGIVNMEVKGDTYEQLNKEINFIKLNERLRKMHDNYGTDDFNRTMRMKALQISREMVADFIAIMSYGKTFDNHLPIGICLPNTCKIQDIEYAMNKVIYPITQMPVVFLPECDSVDKPIKPDVHQWIAIIIFLVLIILSVKSTLYELWRIMWSKKQMKDQLGVQLMLSFSMITNFKSLFINSNPNNRFAFLDGLRTILAFCVLLIHTNWIDFLPIHAKTATNSVGSQLIVSWKYMYITNYYVIDTFFLIGGMMTSYVMFSKLDKSKGSFNYIQYVVFKYFRVVTPVMGTVLLYFIFPLLGNGPNWLFITSALYLPCRDNWFSVLTMISNFNVSPPEKFLCNPSGWYVSAEFQIFLIAPVAFLVQYHYPRIAVWWGLFMSLGLGGYFLIAPKYIWDMPHFLELPNYISLWDMSRSVIQHYWKADTHICTYMLGILCGYLIRKKPNLYLGGRIGETLLWLTTWTLTMGSLYWTNLLLHKYYTHSNEEIFLFISLSKYMYTIGWFWAFYACATDRADFINKTLGWKGFTFTTNLALEISLLHVFSMLYRVSIARNHVVYTHYYVWTMSLADYIITLIISIPFYLLISAPTANLLSILKSSLERKPRNQQKEENKNL
ncbi:nose resistant to fluoxetine protein 6-like [Oppia nitens]|uniref:nose resistant to fluoxetine protein 6-like n=1 Tax=Oppia nitens TaxID=1686743 RepID=UPI0023DBD6D5|nr:nose resistant to fluoxetine protein 6-like [Oppia nitens]